MAKKQLMSKFIGQYVDVLIDTVVSLKNETEEGIFEKNKPYLVSGWFTDFDKDNIYIGTEKNTISDYFNRTYVIHVAVSKPFDQLEEILDKTETPSDDEFH